MSRKLPYKILILIAVTSFFWQCSLKTVNINTLRPADITMPADINTLLIVDRTKYEHKRDEIIHDVFSGGIPGEDRTAAQAAISSLNNALQLSPRFKVQVATEVLRGNSLTTAFPDPLKWDEINRLCQEYHSDAVISFEIFGSDFVITKGDRMVKRQEKDEHGKDVEREHKEFYARGLGRIRMGIRLYDPKGMTILDQQLFTRTHEWEATGENMGDALAHLVAKSEATRYVASQAAAGYASKIAPMPVRLTREFYSKAKKAPGMEQGTRQADVNDWTGALSTWTNALNNNTPPKQAGQLCYNIAVANEVLGNLDEAKKWASRAYVQYGNKKARDYANMLDARKSDEERVNEQMK